MELVGSHCRKLFFDFVFRKRDQGRPQRKSNLLSEELKAAIKYFCQTSDSMARVREGQQHTHFHLFFFVADLGKAFEIKSTLKLCERPLCGATFKFELVFNKVQWQIQRQQLLSPADYVEHYEEWCESVVKTSGESERESANVYRSVSEFQSV